MESAKLLPSSEPGMQGPLEREVVGHVQDGAFKYTATTRPMCLGTFMPVKSTVLVLRQSLLQLDATLVQLVLGCFQDCDVNAKSRSQQIDAT